MCSVYATLEFVASLFCIDQVVHACIYGLLASLPLFVYTCTQTLPPLLWVVEHVVDDVYSEMQ